MRIRHNLKRITKFFWSRRGELLDQAFWVQVRRVVRERFLMGQSVTALEFKANLAAVERRPRNLHIELTNICNADCIFCAYQYQKRKQMVMEERVFRKALDDYCDIGGGDLMLEVVVGDPLVDKNFLERVREARSRPQIRSIETISNGILLNRFGIHELLTSGLSRLQISVAAFDAQVYERIFRNQNYPKLKENVFALLKANSEMGQPIRVKLAFRSSLTMKETLELADYLPLKRFPHDVEFNTDFDTWTGEIKQDDLLPGMHLRPASKFDKEPCLWLYDGPIVFVDGSVGLCGCRDYNADSELVVGHILKENLISIWQSERVQRLRDKFRQQNLPAICQKCTTYANLDRYRSQLGIEIRGFINQAFPTSLVQLKPGPSRRG